MISIRTLTLAGVVAAAAMLPLTARAQGPANQDTYFTFSAPVELPGVTLPAGRYLFKLVDSQSNRHVVRVTSDDRKQLFATLMAIPSYTVGRPTDQPEIRFMESPENAPHAVKLWIYPGRTVGHEFIYPRAQAQRLAKATGEPVLTVKTDAPVSETELVNAEMIRIDREGRDAALAAEARALEADANAQRGTMIAEQERMAQATPVAANVERKELPRTASALPTVALLGFASLAAGAWMLRSRRTAASTR